jgi:hypothetical protein
MLLLLVYVSMMTPLLAAFRLQSQGLARWELVVDAILIIDLLLNFRIGYQDIHKRQVSPSIHFSALRRYICAKDHRSDLLCCIPVGFSCLASEHRAAPVIRL